MVPGCRTVGAIDHRMRSTRYPFSFFYFFRRPGKSYKIQRLLLGTHTDGNELNHLQIAMVQTPTNMDKVDTLKYEEFTNGKGRPILSG